MRPGRSAKRERQKRALDRLEDARAGWVQAIRDLGDAANRLRIEREIQILTNRVGR